ncbi:hypothetical protein Curi_c07230 [Gottschalkia acidurici 9a]|uniref:4Fe-4S ferredoxin-type domain-containing protein n=1 Tax=Gottschalkia acidurici (strain ATCC 7906 / DSM 604 / BCRC 14475 / CIP 104303 / KCTC 5404 / NCIMB 10678 / 9a) TaxID=1128398 RepID=K0AZK1_GOTA9|nr:4Fe-4S binding protein [Gottschalkia acidurici]AFS77796.1 hypothetical protein Curi_c07230 [Gottschalkia acidurici 9a]
MKTLWGKYSFIIILMIIILGLFNPRIALVGIVCMIGPIVTSFRKGRYWCKNICPRGNLLDNVMAKASGKRKTPMILRSNIFRLMIVGTMLTIFAIGLKQGWGSTLAIGMILYRMIVVTTFISVIISLLYNHRTWCSFCPIGSISTFIWWIKSHKKI